MARYAKQLQLGLKCIDKNICPHLSMSLSIGI